MYVQVYETQIKPGKSQAELEYIYRSLNQRLGYPPEDADICEEMKISLDEFHKILDQLQDLNLGVFEKIHSDSADYGGEPLVCYIPDAGFAESALILRKSEIRQRLARAIDQLPELERLVTSLRYYDGLILKEIAEVLEIDHAGIVKLHTKAMLRLRSNLVHIPQEI